MKQVVILCKERKVKDGESAEHWKQLVPDTGDIVILSFKEIGKNEDGLHYYHCVLNDAEWEYIKEWVKSPPDTLCWDGNTCFSSIKNGSDISEDENIYSHAELVMNYEIEDGDNKKIIKAKRAKKEYGKAIVKAKLMIPHRFFGMEVE